jgi:putative component of toxin-antitoxin plasmid stabilization module
MRYRATARFDRSLARLDPQRKARVQAAVERLIAGFEVGQLPSGVGLKAIGHGLWELRAGLADRVVFTRSGDVVEFLLAGNHDEIRRLLRGL